MSVAALLVWVLNTLCHLLKNIELLKMEIEESDDGRLRVKFNGTLYGSCNNDFDCPGELVCVRNQTWMVDAEMCVCPLSLGRTGLHCTDQHASAWVLIGISIVVVFLAAVSILANVNSISIVLRNPAIRERIPPKSALFTTMVLSTIASVFICLQGIYQISSHFLPRTTPLHLNGVLSKQSVLVYFNLTTTTISFIFGLSAALNISLVLIEIADRVSKGHSRIHVNVYVYRKFLVGYSLVYGILMVGFAAAGRAELTFLIVAPGVLFVAITFFVGWIRLSKLYINNDVGNNGGATEKVQEAIANIRQTSLLISACSLGIIVTGVLQVVLDQYNRPNSAYPAIAGRVFWIFSILTIIVLSRYTRGHVTGKLSSSRKQSSHPADAKQQQQATGNQGDVVAARVTEETTE